MADAGQMLAQLQGNGFLQYYAQGAQIAAGITSLNQKIAADTFQNNLNSVDQAMKQSQQQFQNQLQAQELQVHTQNAETERMFANQKLDPTQKALNNALTLAKIGHYNTANTVPTFQGPPPADGELPTQGGSLNSSGLPIRSNDMGTVSATGGPGVLPVLNGSPIVGQPAAPNAGPVDVTDSAFHQTGGAYRGQGDVVTTPPPQPALAAALDAAKNHQEQYGQSWQDSLNPDNDASPAELASAQAIDKTTGSGPTSQPLEGTLNDLLKQRAGNPLLNPGFNMNAAPATAPAAPSVPATKDQGQAAPETPPIQQAQPKTGFFNKGNGVAYKVSQDAKGNLVQTNYTWDGKIPKGSAAAIGWVPSKAKPEVVWSPNADHASEITVDGKTYVKEGFNVGTNGDVSSSHYKLKSGGDGTVNVTTSTAPSGQRYDVITDASGKILKTDRVINAKDKPPTQKMPSFDTTQQLNDLIKGTQAVPTDPQKAQAFQDKYGRPLNPSSQMDWNNGYKAFMEPRVQALQQFRSAMRQTNTVDPTNPSASAAPINTGSNGNNSVPSWASKYLPTNGK